MTVKNKSQSSSLVLYLISLASSILLFLFVQYDNNQTIYSNSQNAGASIVAEETVQNVPIEINIDQEEYYVSGVPESATLYLRGPQPVILQAISASRVAVTTEDLSALGPGTHEVPLIFETNSRRLDYSIEPRTINITIEERVVEEKEVNVQVDEEIFADGYIGGIPELSQSTVTVSGPRSEVEQIEEAVVHVNNIENVTSNINESFTVVMLDGQGEILNVQADPAQVNVRIPVTQAESEKEVPVSLNLVGDDNPNQTFNVSFANAADQSVIIAGRQEDLAEINAIEAEVDVSEINQDTSLVVSLTRPSDVKLSTDQIRVNVSVVNSSSANSVEQVPPQGPNPENNDSSEEEISPQTSNETNADTVDSQEETVQQDGPENPRRRPENDSGT